jgi:hypothetical protein
MKKKSFVGLTHELCIDILAEMLNKQDGIFSVSLQVLLKWVKISPEPQIACSLPPFRQ